MRGFLVAVFILGALCAFPGCEASGKTKGGAHLDMENKAVVWTGDIETEYHGDAKAEEGGSE